MCYRSSTKKNICIRTSPEKYIKDNYISKERETELIRAYGVSRETATIVPIIKNNLRYINLVAEKYVKLAGNYIVYKDLVGAGVLGLISALNSYDTSVGGDFQTHADVYVRSAIIKELNLFNASRIPRNVWQMLSNITFVRTCTNCKRRCMY
ncbi:MAG: hypothetical protein PHF56_24640 [Desulfuromonadaceae bacterium]|nr:hypothetical protein [Desulfuromonadaceae bacterium]